MSRASRHAVVLGAAAAAMASAGWFVAREHPNLFGDAAWYARATRALTGSQPLYPREWLGPHVAAWPLGFNLPPADAVFGPIASLSSTLWGVLMALALVGGLAILWPRLPDPWDIVLLCGVVAYWPFWSALIWANINSLVFLLLAIAFRWPRQSGWTMGAGAALKAAPVLILAVLVGRREWRQLTIALLTGTALTLAVVAVTGPETLVDFVRVQVHETHPSLDYGWSADELLPKALAVICALSLAVVAVVRRGSWSWAVAATLVLVPTLWLHYWMWALVPLLGRLRARFPFAEVAGREHTRTVVLSG